MLKPIGPALANVVARLPNDEALERYADHVAAIRRLAIRFLEATDAGFYDNVAPDALNWGHVGDVDRVRELLEEAADIAKAYLD